MLGKKFILPQLEMVISPALGQKATLLAMAGGNPPESLWLQETAGHSAVFCADKGIEACLNAGIVPKALWGDCDSTSAELYARAQRLGTEVHSFPREKDDTDLQLLLKELPEGDLICSGVWGGRFDHLYSNVFSLLQYKLKRKNQVLLADSRELMVLLQAGEAAELSFKIKPYSVSLLPLSSKTMVDFSGVHWPLSNAELELLHPYAISNEAEEKSIVCKCHNGYVGLYCCFEKA